MKKLFILMLCIVKYLYILRICIRGYDILYEDK